jgi:hypothetical protein
MISLQDVTGIKLRRRAAYRALANRHKVFTETSLLSRVAGAGTFPRLFGMVINTELNRS